MLDLDYMLCGEETVPSSVLEKQFVLWQQQLLNKLMNMINNVLDPFVNIKPFMCINILKIGSQLPALSSCVF